MANPPYPGNIGGFIRAQIAQGNSASAALDELRAQGYGMRTGNFYAAYGQTADMLARSPYAASLDPTVLPGPGDYGTVQAGSGGKFGTRLAFSIRDTRTGDTRTQFFDYVTKQAHTPEEAEENMMANLTDETAEGEYHDVVLGGITVNVYQTVPYTLSEPE